MKWRSALDVLASLAMLVAAFVILWKYLHQPGAQARQPLSIPQSPVATEGAVAVGRRDAPIVVVEFSEFQCPFCARFASESFSKLSTEFVDSGKVRFVFRHFPLEDIHQRARPAARWAVCAERMGRFWPFQQILFSAPQKLQDADLLEQARMSGIDPVKLADCADDDESNALVSRDLDLGKSLGVKSTPTFFIGPANQDGSVRVRKTIEGAQPYTTFSETISSLLGEVESVRR